MEGLILLGLVVILQCFHVVILLQCRNSDGNPVDWFIIYKLPELKHNKSNSILHDGYGYFYMDADQPKFALSKESINSSNTALYHTLQGIYTSPNNSIFYAMYNDQPPNKEADMKHGHTKGVVAFDKKQGYWLVHSTPHFPPIKSQGYSYPHSGLVYGQQFLCITMPSSEINNTGEQFLYNYPKFYDYSLPKWMVASNNTAMKKALDHVHITGSPSKHLVNLTSSAGVNFTSFAKNKNFSDDLYAGWLAPYFNSDMFAETWLNGEGRLNSSCNHHYKVFNIKKIALPNYIKFKETKDHSKWAITRQGNHYVCVGDINREITQEKRGGGTVCFSNKDVWLSYNSTISIIQQC